MRQSDPRAEAVLARCTAAVPLCFFGVEVELRCRPEDLDDARFFFGRHPGTGQAPEVRVAVDAEGGFFRSLLAKDGALKQVVLCEGSEPPRLLAEFKDWSGAPSAVPPFASRVMQERVVVARGTVVQSPAGRTVCLVGANYIGKTTAALGLLSRGWRLASDHLLVLRRGDGLAEPYLSPLGLRRETLATFTAEGRLEGVPTRSTVSEVTGRVVLVHPWDVFPLARPEPARIDQVVHMVRQPGPPRVLGLEPTPALSAFPEDGAAVLARHLPRHCTVLGLDEVHAPGSIAQALLAALEGGPEATPRPGQVGKV